MHNRKSRETKKKGNLFIVYNNTTAENGFCCAFKR